MKPRLKNRNILTFTTFLLTFILGFSISAHAEITAVCGEGFLEMINGHRIIHLKGTPYEMGYQYGSLVTGELLDVIVNLKHYAETFGVPPVLSSYVMDLGGSIYMPFFLEEELEQLRGIIGALNHKVPGHNVELKELVFLNSLVDAGGFMGEIFCDGFAAWGDLTVDGKVFQTRNIDLMIGSGLENFTALIINKEDGKVPFINLGWTGFIGVASGMNAYGIAVSQIWAKTVDHQFGRPWVMNVRKGLNEKDSARKVAQILIDEPMRTYGSNFVFGDANNVCGWALETNAHHAAIFRDNDPKELEARYRGECYAIRIPNAVLRSGAAMDPTIRSLQTASNGPDGDPREASGYKERYKGQADRIIAYRDAGIKIGHEEAETISRETAMRSASMQCCVYANTDLQVWVADSVIDENGEAHPAFQQEYFHYDFDGSLPTLNLTMNRQRLYADSVLTLNMELSTFGNDKRVDVYVCLEIDGNYYFYPSFSTTPQPITKQLAKRDKIEEVLLSVKMPPEFPRGKHTWYGAVINPKTGALADLSICEWQFR